MTRSKKDFTQVAFDVFQKAIGESEKPSPLMGRKASSSKGGKIGGKRRAAAMTEKERSDQAKKAADVRWGYVSRIKTKKKS